jgi:poly-beta-1,6-N-acetyl-D-glucosamine N-deacetylase
MQSNNSFSSNDMFDDYGVITIMYHRFEENKYPSTNIRINDFKTHLEILKEKKISFINANEFEKKLKENKKEKKILITIDDAYLSFYKKAWPLLKKDKIPFILFVSTREVGKHNYMSWDQIREISKENFVHIGNHSHTHEYLIDLTPKEIEDDIKKSISIFKKEIGYNSQFFSYPFGEYSLKFKNIINDLGFKYAFGQHSGVSDETKDFLELPRFPLNEKYGKIDRFTSLLKTLPFKYESIVPNEKYINKKTNPPEIKIEFKKNIKNLNQVTCYSNEEDKWRKSNINFNKENILTIKLAGKFITERGRINCSLREGNGYWRWLGIQFVVAEK